MTDHKTNGVAGLAVAAPLPERPARPSHYVAPPAPPLPPPKPEPPAAPAVRVRPKKHGPTQRFAVTVDGGRQFIVYAENENHARGKFRGAESTVVYDKTAVTTLGEVSGLSPMDIQLDNVQTDKELRDSRERQQKAGVVVCDWRDRNGTECCDTPASHEHPAAPGHEVVAPMCFQHKCPRCVPLVRR